jgi:hypothetical protein
MGSDLAAMSIAPMSALVARSWAALVRQWPLLLVLAVAGTALIVVGNNHFKRGTVLFAMAICLAALLRAVLPDGAAGLLRVRSRVVDVVTMAALGSAALVAALVVPPPS